MTEYILNGQINDDNEWFNIAIGDKLISQELFEELDLNGKKVQVSFYISDNPFRDETDAIERFLKGVYSGETEGEWCPAFGTSWTGQYGIDEDFTVGGHDLLAELNHYEGKYCLLKIQYE